MLLELGAEVNATDAIGGTPLVTAALEGADASISAMLLAAGARIDFIAAFGLKRYELAETMLRERPSRIGSRGEDTIALHVAVSKRMLRLCAG